jgi:hypothetical protein
MSSSQPTLACAETELLSFVLDARVNNEARRPPRLMVSIGRFARGAPHGSPAAATSVRATPWTVGVSLANPMGVKAAGALHRCAQQCLGPPELGDDAISDFAFPRSSLASVNDARLRAAVSLPRPARGAMISLQACSGLFCRFGHSSVCLCQLRHLCAAFGIAKLIG